MNYIGIGLQVLLEELVGVGVLTGILYIYWEVLKKR